MKWYVLGKKLLDWRSHCVSICFLFIGLHMALTLFPIVRPSEHVWGNYGIGVTENSVYLCEVARYDSVYNELINIKKLWQLINTIRFTNHDHCNVYFSPISDFDHLKLRKPIRVNWIGLKSLDTVIRELTLAANKTGNTYNLRF